MSCEIEFQLPLVYGLHARPASAVREAAAAFTADVQLLNRRNGRSANAKSVLSLVAADVREGDPCVLTIDGPDADRACPALRAFVADVLPGCDEALPQASPAEAGATIVPRALTNAEAKFLRGTPVSAGASCASVLIVGGITLPEAAGVAAAPDEESARFVSALAEVGAAIERTLSHAGNSTERDILQAHLDIVRDPEFADRVQDAIRGGASAGTAVLAAEAHYADILLASESAYLRERALDTRDIAAQLLAAMYGTDGTGAPVLTEPTVCVADSLTPSQFLALDRQHLRGLVLTEGGVTSHTTILARAFGIPCVVGVPDAHRALRPGQTVIVDGRRGLVVPDPSEPVSRYYALEMRRDATLHERLAARAAEEARTADGRRVQVAANAATPEEAEAAFAGGAEGIGLFRTEMLFMDRDAAPSEEEQVEVYARVVRAAGAHPVIFRTLDIGGDKPLPYLQLPPEANPFLGYRAIRFYPEHEALVRTQLRALLRAAALGTVWVMFPMVCCVEEVRALKARLQSVADELDAEGVARGPVEVGIMVEVPAAALSIGAFCDEVSFFSIGTNDLAQYTLAVDRGNTKVASLYSPLHPAFLRLLRLVVDEAHARGKFVGLCGEMGGAEANAPLLVGLGLDEISLAGPVIPAMKAAISRCDSAACRDLVDRAIAAPDRAGVEAALSAFAAQGAGADILGPEITRLDSTAASREEVIKELVDNLYLAGRVANPDAVEEAVWAREDIYSTGVGFGFAIPHCKSADVTANSVGILRLREPVAWNSLDGEPVRIALMLAIREADQGEEHLRIFARLARRIMHEEFRESLLTEPSVERLLSFLATALHE